MKHEVSHQYQQGSIMKYILRFFKVITHWAANYRVVFWVVAQVSLEGGRGQPSLGGYHYLRLGGGQRKILNESQIFRDPPYRKPNFFATPLSKAQFFRDPPIEQIFRDILHRIISFCDWHLKKKSFKTSYKPKRLCKKKNDLLKE